MISLAKICKSILEKSISSFLRETMYLSVVNVITKIMVGRGVESTFPPSKIGREKKVYNNPFGKLSNTKIMLYSLFIVSKLKCLTYSFLGQTETEEEVTEEYINLLVQAFGKQHIIKFFVELK